MTGIATQGKLDLFVNAWTTHLEVWYSLDQYSWKQAFNGQVREIWPPMLNEDMGTNWSSVCIANRERDCTANFRSFFCMVYLAKHDINAPFTISL